MNLFGAGSPLCSHSRWTRIIIFDWRSWRIFLVETLNEWVVALFFLERIMLRYTYPPEIDPWYDFWALDQGLGGCGR
jgi:hypothetical protein